MGTRFCLLLNLSPQESKSYAADTQQLCFEEVKGYSLPNFHYDELVMKQQVGFGEKKIILCTVSQKCKGPSNQYVCNLVKNWHHFHIQKKCLCSVQQETSTNKELKHVI